MTGTNLKKNPMYGFGLFGLTIFAIAIIGLLRCERDNPFDPNSPNFKKGTNPEVRFNADSLTCFVKDMLSISIHYKDSLAKGGAVPAVKKLFFSWNGDAAAFTDSMAVSGNDSTIVIKKMFTSARDTIAYVQALDNDGERSIASKTRLIVKGEKVAITKIVASRDSVLAGDTVTLRVSAKDSGTSGSIQNFIWTINGVDSTNQDSVFKTVFTSPGNQVVFVKAQSSDSVFSATGTIKISVNMLVDSTLPVIEFISPDSMHDTVFSSKTVVTVQVKDPVGISFVLINGGTGAKLTDSVLAIWQDTVSLNEGPNPVTVIAFDKSPLQNRASKSITVTYIKQDVAPPLVIFTAPRQNDTVYQSPAGVVVSVTDPSGVAWALCNGDTMTNASGSSYTAYVALKEGKDSVVIRTEDKKGNAAADTLIFNYVVRDMIPPTVRIVSPHSGEQITAADVTVTVVAADTGLYATGVDSVTIKGIRASYVSGYFVRTIQLKHGYDTVRVEAWDASANHNFKRDSVIVARNVPPRFVPDSVEKDISLTLGQASTITLCAADADSTDALKFAFLSRPDKSSTVPQIAAATGGCATITGYTPNTTGLDTFAVEVADNYNGADTLHLRVFIKSSTATKPYFTTDTNKISDTAFPGMLYAVQLGATDPRGAKLAYSLGTKSPAGAKIDSVSAKVTWTPQATDTGKSHFVAFVTNGSEFDTLHWTVAVVMPDVPPHLKNPGNKTVNEMQPLSFTLSATDSNNDQLVYSFKLSLPPGATLDSASGVFNWTPTYQEAGVYPIVFKVNEKNRVPPLADSVTDTITVIKVNVPPVLANPGPKTVNELQSLTFNLQASDVNRDLITFSMNGAPAGATIVNGNTFAWTPTSSQGGVAYPITFYATDNGVPPMRDSAKITITVIDSTSPVFGAHALLDTVYLGSTYASVVKAVDEDNDPLTYTKLAGPDGLAVTEKYGVVIWKPFQAYIQPQAVSIVAKDHAGNADTISWQIMVMPKWPRVFGDNTTMDTGYAVVQTADGYALCGTVAAPATGYRWPFFMRTDTLGNPVQYKTFGGAVSFASASSLVQTNDGGFIICGSDSTGNLSKLLLIKINANGDTSWTFRSGGAAIGPGGISDRGLSVCQALDYSGFIACGTARRGTSPNNRVFVVKVNSLGKMVWENSYGSNTGTGYGIQALSDGFIVCGEIANGTGSTGTDLYLLKCGPTGGVLWSNTNHPSGTSRNVGLSVASTFDGFIIGGCYTSSFTVNSTAGFVVKVGTQGTFPSMWTATLAVNTAITSVKVTSAGDYIACGSTATGSGGGLDVLLLRYSTQGQMVWTKTQGGLGNDAAFSVFPTKGAGFIITGYTTRNASADIYLSKTDGQGEIVK